MKEFKIRKSEEKLQGATECHLIWSSMVTMRSDNPKEPNFILLPLMTVISIDFIRD